MSNEDWLVRKETGGGILYEITQNKYAPLRTWFFLLGAAVGSFGVSALFFYVAHLMSPDGKHPVAFAAVPFGFIGLFFVFATFGGLLILIPATLARKARVQFHLKGHSISLQDKLKRGYPDIINFDDVSHIHYGIGGAPSSGDSMIVAGGLAGATAVMASDGGNRLRRKVAETGYGVWLNVKGRDVYLTNALTEPQALYLFSELKQIIRSYR